MKYVIITSPVSDEKKAKLLARAVQSKAPGISFSELTQIIMREEFKAGSNLSKDACDQLKRQLEELGVLFRVEAMIEEIIVKPEVVDKPTTPPIQVHAAPIRKPEIISTIQAKPVAKNRVIAPVVSLVSILMIVGFLILAIRQENEKREFRLNGEPFSGKNGQAPKTQPMKAGSSQADSVAQNYTDSADAKCFSNGADTERLYRFALSYNQNNKNAWFGLLNCYRSTNRESEALKIEAEMTTRFGKDVINPQTFPLEFGSVEVRTITDNSASIVLTTSEKNNILYGDLFQIARRYTSLGKFTSLKILAKRADGAGLFLTMTPIGCLSYSDFIAQSKIDVIE